MMLTIVFCTFVFVAANEEQAAANKLLKEISSTVVNDMVTTLDSKDVLTIDAALRQATAKVQLQLKELATLKGVTLQRVARQVSKRVAGDKRLLEALKKRESSRGKVSPRSSSLMYLNNLVFHALTGNP